MASDELHSALKTEFDKNQKIFRFVERIRFGDTEAEYNNGPPIILNRSTINCGLIIQEEIFHLMKGQI